MMVAVDDVRRRAEIRKAVDDRDCGPMQFGVTGMMRECTIVAVSVGLANSERTRIRSR